MNCWILPSDPTYFDLEGCLNDFGVVYWHQSKQLNNLKSGDLIFIYSSHQDKYVKFIMTTQDVGLSTDDIKEEEDKQDAKYLRGERSNNKKCCILKKIKQLSPNDITWNDLQDNGVNGPIQSPKKLEGDLLDYFADKIGKDTFRMLGINIFSNESNSLVLKVTKLLNVNKNVILTGAPGTGKTYLAKQIAQQMIFDEVKEKMNDEEQKQFNEQTDFVQFHPSYDYTDFVEGLRPTPPNEDGNVGFERKDGVFKEFCAKALKNYMDSSKQKNEIKDDEVFEKVYSSLLNDIEDETIATYPTKRSGEQPVFLNEKRQIKLGQSNGKPKSVKKEYLKILFGLYKDENINHSEMSQEVINEAATKFIDGVNSLDYIQYRWTLSELVKKYKKIKNTISLEQIQTIELKPFVFIIDEINRGEINKIFGELFFSIDPGYRGEKGRVQTQYQNMVEDDAFKKGFFVPENVYIIGTMNDIDRSVESMDFAFRRRFAFKEVTAKETQTMLDSDDAWKDETGVSQKPENDVIDEIKARMNSLNAAIEEIEGLSSAYHIGASYFLKLANYKGKNDSYNFDELWIYHLEGLLREYLRGMPNAEDNIIKLHNAYNKGNSDNKSVDVTENESTANSGQSGE